MKILTKITLGRVSQRFEKVDGEYKCISQQFFVDDIIYYGLDEDFEFLEEIKPTLEMEQAYFPFEMKQPERN